MPNGRRRADGEPCVLGCSSLHHAGLDGGRKGVCHDSNTTDSHRSYWDLAAGACECFFICSMLLGQFLIDFKWSFFVISNNKIILLGNIFSTLKLPFWKSCLLCNCLFMQVMHRNTYIMYMNHIHLQMNRKRSGSLRSLVLADWKIGNGWLSAELNLCRLFLSIFFCHSLALDTLLRSCQSKY